MPERSVVVLFSDGRVRSRPVCVLGHPERRGSAGRSAFVQPRRELAGDDQCLERRGGVHGFVVRGRPGLGHHVGRVAS